MKKGIFYTGNKTYHEVGGQDIFRHDATGQHKIDPSLSQKLWNHSPDGFQWGYGGSGPAQTALAILLDFTGDSKLSSDLHQQFKWDIIAILGSKFKIMGEDIQAWIDSKKPVGVI